MRNIYIMNIMCGSQQTEKFILIFGKTNTIM